jgi:hypothetical protein
MTDERITSGRRSRFVVSTCTGFLTARKGRSSNEPGVTACVLDSLDCYRVVALWRSEDRVTYGLPPAARRQFTIDLARAHAATLNAQHRLEESLESSG